MDLIEIYFRKEKKHLERITNYTILYTILLIAVLLIILMFSIAVYREQVFDPVIPVTPISEEQLAKLANVKVETGIFVRDFSQFDMLKNSFVAEATIWFYYNPATVDKKLIDNFSFEKAAIKSKSQGYETHYGNKILVLYDVELALQGNFNYSHFPLDPHRLDFSLINRKATPEKILYVTNPESVQLANDANTQGWTLLGKSTKYGYEKDDLSLSPTHLAVSYERTVFSFFYEHSSLKEAFIIFLPLFLMFMVALLSLLLDMVYESTVIFALGVGSLLALVLYSEYIRSFTPVTGILTLVDAFYILLMLLTGTMFLMQIFVLYFFRRKQKKTQIKEVLEYTYSSLNILRSLLFLIAIVAIVSIVFYVLVLR